MARRRRRLLAVSYRIFFLQKGKIVPDDGETRGYIRRGWRFLWSGDDVSFCRQPNCLSSRPTRARGRVLLVTHRGSVFVHAHSDMRLIHATASMAQVKATVRVSPSLSLWLHVCSFSFAIVAMQDGTRSRSSWKGSTQTSGDDACGGMPGSPRWQSTEDGAEVL